MLVCQDDFCGSAAGFMNIQNAWFVSLNQSSVIYKSVGQWWMGVLFVVSS